MIVEVRTRRDYRSVEPIRPQILFNGEWPLDYIPRVGEYLTLWKGWASHTVKEVWHCAHDKSVEIVLDVYPCKEFKDIIDMFPKNELHRMVTES